MICTGFTDKLVNDGQSFNDFVMRCARGMSPLISLRDCDLDGYIPETIEPTDYHAEELKKAKKKLAKLQAMTKAQRVAFGEKEKKKAIDGIKKYMEEGEEVNQRIQEMIAKVEKWNPPTKEHVALKGFMLSQLKSSFQCAFEQRRLTALTTKTPLELYKEEMGNLKWNIEYHTDENQKEIKRAKFDTKWLQQLRKSLKTEEQKLLEKV